MRVYTFASSTYVAYSFCRHMAIDYMNIEKTIMHGIDPDCAIIDVQ